MYGRFRQRIKVYISKFRMDSMGLFSFYEAETNWIPPKKTIIHMYFYAKIFINGRMKG